MKTYKIKKPCFGLPAGAITQLSDDDARRIGIGTYVEEVKEEKKEEKFEAPEDKMLKSKDIKKKGK